MKKKFTLLLLIASMLLATKSFAQCTTPSNLAVSFGNNTSAFTWDAITGATYRFQIKFSYSTSWQTLADGLTTNDYTHTGLFQSATFNWRVISFCSPTDSAFSASQTYIVPCESPSAPIASNITGTTATVSWTWAPSIPQIIPTYSVSYRILGSNNPWTVVGSTTTNSIAISGLFSNTAYEWCVTKGCSYFSSAPLFGQFTTQYVPCDIPIDLRTTSVSSNSASLAWNHVNGYANYYVQYKKATDANWITSYAPNNSRVLSGLTKETIYDWRVMANCTNAYQSVYSPIKQFTTYSNPCMAFGNNVNEGIDYFSLGSIARVSGKEIGGYFKSNLSTDLAKGSINNLVTISAVYPPGIGYGDYFAVYIDYNKNGTFTDAGEQVIAPLVRIVSQSSNYTAAFAVPANAPLGVTKMRVILNRQAAIVPCATGFQGELEDYNVKIVNQVNNFMSNLSEATAKEEKSTLTISASPNPSSGRFIISVPVNFNADAYTVKDIYGNRQLYSKINSSKSQIEINLSDKPKGVYFFTITNAAGETKTTKLVLQ